MSSTPAPATALTDTAPAPAPRTFTPDRTAPGADGRPVTTFTLKRGCNGCGHLLGDIEDRDADDDGNLTDVRAECPNCAPVVALEQAGCRTWRVTKRSFQQVVHEIDQLHPWVFTKGFWKSVDGELQVVGLRVGSGSDRVVAFWGDWIIQHPDRHFSIHTAPAQDGGEHA